MIDVIIIVVAAILADAASQGGAARPCPVTRTGFVCGGIKKALLLWDSAHSLNLTRQEHRIRLCICASIARSA